VVDVYDHRHLNLEVEEFKHVIPTTENLAIAIWKRLENQIEGPSCTASGFTRRPTILRLLR
jgi:6-pyruvoyl-tetrahydropterin synthase